MVWPLMAWVFGLALSGQVRDAITREPVEGVAVQVVGTNTGTITGRDGRFRLESPGGSRIRFTRLGYVATELQAHDSTLDVLLVPSARSLEGVTIAALRGEGGASGGAPISQRVIDKEELEKRYSGQEMPLLLTQTTSVTSYADAGAYSNYTYLRLRGIDQTRLNITLDGVPLGDAEDEAVYFSNFPDFGNSIQSVQVQRGVGTSSQGMAPYAGSINFQSIALIRSTRGAEAQLSRGSFNSNRGSVEWQSGTLGTRFAAYGRLSSQQTDGYRRHSGNRSLGGFASAGYFGDRGSLKVTAFSGVSRNQESYLASTITAIERDPRDNPLTEAERDRFTHTLLSIAMTRLVGPAATLSATAYTVRAGGDYDVLINGLWNFNLESRVSGGFFTWNQQRGPLTVSAGAHANAYSRDHWLYIRPDLATRVYLNTGHKDEASGFTKAKLDIGRATVFGDVQVRRAWYRYVPDAHGGIAARSVHWTFLNPKAGVTYRLNQVASVYGSLGANGREPTRNDMFAGFDNVDSTNAGFVGPLTRVHPERVRDLEAGVSVSGTTLSLAANLYAMEFRNEITPIGALSYIGLPLRKNIPSSHRRGLEVDARYRATRYLMLMTNATFSENRIQEYTDDASGLTYHDVEPLLTPRLVSNQGVELEVTPKLSLLLDGRYLSRSYLANTGDANFVTPAAYAVDLALNWHLSRVAVLTQVRNVTDAHVYTGGYIGSETIYGETRSSPAYYLLAGRNLIVTARFGF